MKSTRSILTLVFVLVTFCLLLASEVFFDLRASAQKTCINKDGTQTTSESDNTYGEGGTKETVRDANGRIIKVLKKDKEGKRRSSSTYFCGNKECGSDAFWDYDSKGRLVSFVIYYTDTPFSEGGAGRRKIKYANDDDTKGTSTDERLGAEGGEWKPATTSQTSLIDSASGPDPIHDYSSDKPESIIGDLGVKPAPSPSPSPSTQPFPKIKLGLDYKFKSMSSPGLISDIVTFPSGGKLIINFPNDLAVGDTFSGTVQTETVGKDEKQRGRNQSELDRAVILIGGQPTRVSEKIFTRIIPMEMKVDAAFLVLKVNGKEVCSAPVKISKAPIPQPANTQLPTCGQMGRNVLIVDHCDGLIAPTDSCSIGRTQLQPLAESPRLRVLQNTSQTPSQTEIKYSEQGKQVTGPFMNLGVNLSSPNTNLVRGQKTTMKVVALVKGIQQDVSLDIANDTPGVVTISGGDNQHFIIHPADVQADGSYHQNFTVTANQAGAWGATATVSCVEVRPGGPTPTPTPTPTSATAPTSLTPSSSPCAPTPSPMTYSVKDLKVLPTIDGSTPSCMATGVNDAGNVVGTCFGKYTGGGSRAFRTDSGGAVIKADDDLGLPAGIKGGYSFATGVNADGHVVGYWSGGGDKAFWHDGSKGSKMISLHPDGFMTSKAFALNIHDDVVGAAFALTFGPVSFGITFDGHAVIWPHVDADHKAMKDLNKDLDVSVKKDWILKVAFGISDDGDIVGRAYNKKTGKYHAFLLKGVGGKFFDLGALKEDVFDSSAAYALKPCDAAAPEIDKVVGYTYTDSKTHPGKAFHYGFVWTDGSGLKEMETLPPYSKKTDLLESFAQAINTKAELVGAVSFGFHLSQAFEYEVLGPGPGLVGDSCVPNSHAIWYNGKDLKDLNELIPGFPGWALNLANGINEKGWIVGSGFFKCSTLFSSKLSKAVLLIPAGSSLLPPAPGPVSACPIAVGSGDYIFNNWNICGVKNGPTKDTTFTIDAPYLITFIATYHWNYGSGALPGHKGISLKSSDGTVYGPFLPVITSSGEGGAPNVGWECHPGITLPAGTYTIVDPDPATWSQNDGSWNSGFARVAGSPSKK